MNSFKIKPHITEKTLRMAKDHNIYTFLAPVYYTKDKVKTDFKKYLGLDVLQVRLVKLPEKERGKFSLLRSYKKPARRKIYVKFSGEVDVPGYTKLMNKK